jgi:aldose 1-epimerase
VPWSNRIGHGRFDFGGRTWRIAPNHPKQPYPIHGEGWLRPWDTLERSELALMLGLDRRDASPFAYAAQLSYTVEDATLGVELVVENCGFEPMPYGLGLHPWFERTPDVTLHAPARGMWVGGPDVLPVSHTAPPADADFARPSALPRRLLDNCFTGWNGLAVVTWPERGMALHIDSTPRLDTYVCYCPVGKNVFCFEPVTHPIDAFNLPEPYTRAGLTVLAPGERMSIRVAMRAQPVGESRSGCADDAIASA